MKLTIFNELAKIKDEELTGRYHFKHSFFGMVLMVEYKYSKDTHSGSIPMLAWRLGTADDANTLGLSPQPQ